MAIGIEGGAEELFREQRFQIRIICDSHQQAPSPVRRRRTPLELVPKMMSSRYDERDTHSDRNPLPPQILLDLCRAHIWTIRWLRQANVYPDAFGEESYRRRLSVEDYQRKS